MITKDGKLQIFEDFLVDQSLPKFKRDESGDTIGDSDEEGFGMEMKPQRFRRRQPQRFHVSSGDEFTFNPSIGSGSTPVNLAVAPGDLEPSLKDRLLRLVGRSPKAPPVVPPPVEQTPALSVLQFFESIKHSFDEILIVKDRAEGYDRAMVNALKAGQVALVEQLRDGIHAYRQETQLVAMGLSKFVTEETIVSFSKKCPKGLRLDWVRNFVRTIPDDVVAKKVRADDLGCFDNYVVLHYDPATKAYAETQAEKSARKDPILFGVMEGRRVLYFVGDWVDELCDLTLDQIADSLGAEAVKTIASLP